MRFFSFRKMRSATPARSRRLTCRPRLEILGDRCLLSASPLDPTFGSGGIATSAVTANLFPYSTVLQADAKILEAGTVSSSGIKFGVARYTSSGSLDTSFGSGGETTTKIGSNAQAYAMALQSDGKIVLAGQGNPGKTGADFALARYNTSGSLDTTFGSKGTLTTAFGSAADYADALVIQSDGKIVAVGNVTPARYYDEWALTRFNSDGSLDGTFGSGGEVIQEVVAGAGVNDIAFAVAMQADGKIVAAGTHNYHVGGVSSFALGRFNPDGSLDTTFNGTGIVTTQVGTGSDARGVAIQPADGKIVVAGGSSLGAAVARYLATDPQIGSFTASPNPVPAGSTITLTVTNITDVNPSASITQVAIY